MARSYRLEEAQFYSGGSRVAAHLYVPDALDDATATLPAVVFCHGWGGTRDVVIPEFAAQLCRHGFAVLGFDYRGYGDSEGARNRLMPLEQAADIVAAAAFLRNDSRIDPARISALGLLTGSAAALEAAASFEGISAVVCFYPFGDGARWLRSVRPWWQWLELLDKVDSDRTRRSLSGVSEELDPSDVLARDPEARRREEERRAADPRRGAWRLGYDSVEAILAFKPEDHLHRISPRPVMVIAAEKDLMLPVEEAERVWERLEDPKRLLLLEGVDHHEVYEPARVIAIFDEITEFLGAR